MSKRALSLDMDSMTFRELEMFEDITGRPLDQMVRQVPERDPETGRVVPDPDDPKGRPLMRIEMDTKTLLALITISLHRDDPSVTVETVRDLKLSDFDFEATDSAMVDPTEAEHSADSSAPPA